MGTKHHTTLNLDQDLVREAQQVLGTVQITETVHRALEEIVDRKRRETAFDHDYPGLTPEALEEARDESGVSGNDMWNLD